MIKKPITRINKKTNPVTERKRRRMQRWLNENVTKIAKMTPEQRAKIIREKTNEITEQAKNP